MRGVLDSKKSIGDYLRLTWYFEKPLEKIILVLLSLIGFSTIMKWIFNWLG